MVEILTYLAAIVAAIVEVVKRATKLSTNWCPLVALLLGIPFGLFMPEFKDLVVFERVVTGLVIGLASGGVYSIVKKPTKFATGKIISGMTTLISRIKK